MNASTRGEPLREAPATGGHHRGFRVPLGGTCDGEGKPITTIAVLSVCHPSNTALYLRLRAILSPPPATLRHFSSGRDRPVMTTGERLKPGTQPGFFLDSRSPLDRCQRQSLHSEQSPRTLAGAPLVPRSQYCVALPLIPVVT